MIFCIGPSGAPTRICFDSSIYRITGSHTTSIIAGSSRRNLAAFKPELCRGHSRKIGLW
jgi:hypothetical protein